MSSMYPDLFKGTAPYYSRYRPGYPDAMISAVVSRFGLDGTGKLLDLGCGTGQLLLPLAPHVQTAIGMDPEPEMLSEAARVADEAGIENVDFFEGGSLDLQRYRNRLDGLRLTTMGRAFHWMDSDATLRALGSLTVPGGGVVLCGESCDIWDSQRDWQLAVRDVIQRWLGSDRRAGSGTYKAATSYEPWSDVLARSPFKRFEVLRTEYTRQLDLDGVVGFLYSTSFASPRVLGDRQTGFERDLRDNLTDIAANGLFEEDLILETYMAWTS